MTDPRPDESARRRRRACLVMVAAVLAAGTVAGSAAGGETGSPVASASAPPGAVSTTAAAVSRPSDHEASEGFVLAAADPPQRGDVPCEASAPLRTYEVAALNVDITFNRYLDHDPQGRMYVLESAVRQVREEEARNQRARAVGGEPAVSIGLQNDAIQPLSLRVHQGECLRIVLHNRLSHGEPAGIHIHGSGLHIAGGGGPAIATNPGDSVRPGETVTYEWMVQSGEPEATHYFHSHGDDRFQTGHGLFGALVVEPKGSSWTDPLSNAPAAGWAAIIRLPGGGAFREFVLYYHEVGDENYQLLAKDGQFVPLVDPTTHAYRPDGRALNYRSEPFMNRLLLQQRAGSGLDESLEYSSYAYGDPPTPIMRSYLGDPVKQRVVHAGAEVLHVHHVHGGGIRWLRQPGTEPPRYDIGLDKHPPLRPQVSERTDSQALGPSETFDVADECGSGGCQQSAGDFMYHCHVTEHYFSGMWGIWRVYNTRQDGQASTDVLPPLRELPDRNGRTLPAVTSAALIGRTVSSHGLPTPIDATGLTAWVERQLPPPGVARGHDASVLDWQRQGDVYLGEPETDAVWPGYRPREPGVRPPLLFAPDTGRLAYPLLRPHLNRRPPFAPGHGPAPFLDPVTVGTETPVPGANGPGSDCPAGTRLRNVAVNAMTVPVTLSRREDLVDPFGQLFVLRNQVEAVRADPHARVPLAIRANAGQDCLDVTLRSELEDNTETFSKVGAHIHLVQFDVQASDGVDTGFNYEQTVRPFRAEGESLGQAAPAGATHLAAGGTGRFQAGTLVGVGLDQDASFEVARVASVDAQGLTLAAPLAHAHGPGEIVGTEFVRYRWYPDAQFGTAFFHDHVNVLESGRHGLYGALEAEPPDSTYHDPHTGAPAESGPVADIHTQAQVSLDVRGSFREFLLFLQDDNPITHIGRSSGNSVNLRADPPEARARDPSLRFSSGAAGDPETPVLEARLGDPVALRTLVGASNDIHSLHVDGHWFRVEPNSSTSPPTGTVSVGISERRDLFLPAAGGPQRLPGDYLYYAGRGPELREGSWGLLRVHGPGQGLELRPLPGHEAAATPARSVCPDNAPHAHFDVTAVDAPLPMLNPSGPLRRGPSQGKLYVLARDRAAVVAGRMPPSPLTLHVNVGDCITVTLANATAAGPVSFHADMLSSDPGSSAGVAAGNEPPQAVDHGASRTYTYYASPEVGETTALVRDWGDVLRNPGLGLYGAIVVGPRGARYTDPRSGADVSGGSSWQVDVHPAKGSSYRDDALFFQEEDAGIGTHRMPYTTRVEGTVGLNYTSEPLNARLDLNRDTAAIYRGNANGDPATPLIKAYPGDPVKLHVLAPWSAQAQVFSVEGHRWRLEPGRPGSTMVSSLRFGGLEALTVNLEGGASEPGDYLYGDHREPYREAGLWGIFRVVGACGGSGSSLQPLDGRCPGTPSALWRAVVLGALAVLILAAALLVARRRRRAQMPAAASRE